MNKFEDPNASKSWRDIEAISHCMNTLLSYHNRWDNYFSLPKEVEMYLTGWRD